MAGPLNRRFILTVVALLLIFAAAIIYFATFRGKSIEELVADGDRNVAEGNHKQARKEFETALALGTRKQLPPDVDLLIKFVDAASLEQFDEVLEANRIVRVMVRALKLAMAQGGKDNDYFERLMDLQMYRALELHEFTVWRDIYVSANQVLQNRPEMALAQKRRGTAHVRMLNAGLQPTGTQRHQARQDLEKYLTRNRDDVDAEYHLAWWHMLEADRLASQEGAAEDQVAKARAKSLRKTDDMRLRSPDRAHGELRHATMLLSADQSQKARSIIVEQEQKLHAEPGSAKAMYMLTDLIARIEPSETPEQRDAVLARMIAICLAAHKAHPDEPLFNVIRARSLARSGEMDESLKLLEDVRIRPLKAVALEAARLGYAQNQAMIDQANLLLDKAERETDPSRNYDTIAQLGDLFKAIEKQIRGSAHYFEIAGRFAALRGRWSEAVQHFRSANEQITGGNLKLQLRYADALDKTGQGDEAIPILERILTTGRLADGRHVRYQLVQILINSRHFQDAERHLDILKTDDPEDERLVAMQSVLANNWMSLANTQRESGDLDAAIESLRSAMALAPQDATAQRQLATLHGERGEHDAALEQLRLALALQPEDAPLRNYYARYEQQHGSKQSARQLREQWAKTYPDDVDNRRSLVVLLGTLDEQDEADRVLDELFRDHGKGPQNTLLSALVQATRGDVAAGRRIMEQYVKNRGADATSRDWINLARYLYDYDQFDTALTTYKQAVAVDTSATMVATREMAQRLVDAGRIKDAVPLYRQLYERFANDRQVAQGFVDALIKMGNIKEAQPVVQRLIKTRGPTAATYVFESDIALIAGNLEEAVARLEQASMLAPRDARYHFQIGRLLAGVRGQKTRAIKSFKRAVQLNSRFQDARMALATELIKSGDTVPAIQELQVVVQQDQMHAEARALLANLYERNGQFEESHQLLEESVRMFPNEVRWPQTMANLARRQGNPSESGRHLKKVFELDPSPRTLSSAAIELNKAGQHDDALALMDEHIELIEADPLIHAVRAWALARLNRSSEAHGAYAQALASCRTYPQIDRVAEHLTLGVGVAEAKTLLEKARVSDENDVIVSLAVAALDVKSGDAEAALVRLKQIQAQLPEYSPNRLPAERSIAAALRLSNQLTAATEMYQKILKKAPRDVTSLCGMAWILGKDSRRIDQALRYAQDAAKTAPDSAEALVVLGWTQFRRGEIETAVKALRGSLRIDQSAATCLYLAHVLIKQGDAASRQEAVKLLREAKQLAAQVNDAALEEQAATILADLLSEPVEQTVASDQRATETGIEQRE